jgi:general secretion pathway protein K
MLRAVSRPIRHEHGQRDAGVALLTVLWFLVAMSGLAVTLAALGRDSAHASRNAIRALEVRTVMGSAVEITAATLWRGRVPIDGRLNWRQGPFAVVATVTPESGKIDLNAASDELIEALTAVATEGLGRDSQQALALAHAIQDWRDPDRERRLAGAEAADYAAAGRPGGPRDGPFPFVAELRSVIGMDEALFAVLAPALSVHHGEQQPAVAPTAGLVRQALDRASGLGLGMGGGESSFDRADQPLEGSGSVEPTSFFTADPAGLYTIELELVHDDGPSFRQETVIWIDPPLATARYAVLESRSTLLPPALEQPAGEAAAWPGQ